MEFQWRYKAYGPQRSGLLCIQLRQFFTHSRSLEQNGGNTTHWLWEVDWHQDPSLTITTPPRVFIHSEVDRLLAHVSKGTCNPDICSFLGDCASMEIRSLACNLLDQATWTIPHYLRYSRPRYILENPTLFQMADVELVVHRRERLCSVRRF